MEEKKTEDKKEEETGTSLFDHVMARRGDAEDEMVCLELIRKRTSFFKF